MENNTKKEPVVEESKVEETPVEETPAEEPVEEAPAEEPVEEAPTEEEPAKKFVNPIISWAILAAELAAAIIIGIIACC